MPVFLLILWTISQSWLCDTSTLRGVPIKQGRGQMRCMEGSNKGVQHGQHSRSLRFWVRTTTDHGAGAVKTSSVPSALVAHTFPSCPLHQGPAYVTLWLALCLVGSRLVGGADNHQGRKQCTPCAGRFKSMALSLKQEAVGGKCAHAKLLCPSDPPGISARWCLGQDLLNGKPDEVVTVAQCHSPGGLFLGLLGPSANSNSYTQTETMTAPATSKLRTVRLLQWCPWEHSARENQLNSTCTLLVTWATGSGQL